MDALKRKLLLKGGVLGFMVLLTASVSAVLFGLAQNSAEYAAKLESDVRSAESQIQRFRTENAQFEDVMKIWNGMSEGDRVMAGVRLTAGKSKLEELVGKYWLSEVKTTFSKPEVRSVAAAKGVSVAKTDVAMSFNGVSDGMILDFMENMRREFPGHIQLKKLTIEKKGDLTRDGVKAIAAGTKPLLFTGVMEFSWRDLKYEGGDSAAVPAAAPSVK